MKRNVPLVKRDGRVILNGIAIGLVYKNVYRNVGGWSYRIALKDRPDVGSWDRQSDAVIALMTAWRERGDLT